MGRRSDDEEMMPSRREVLVLAGSSLVAATACREPEPVGPSPAAVSALREPIHHSSAVALARAIREGDLSALEVVDLFLARIESVNPSLNAVVQLEAETARQTAREADEALARGEAPGPLHGVPMTIKDSFDTAGMISTGGTRGREAFVPESDATVVKRLRDAGAILLGKTNTPELTLSFETDNLIYGRTSNPHDLSRTSGGSSGGAAAIVAAGGAPFDIGSDYGGSIRLPSHFCGISGLKPTSGRVPRTGHIFPFGGLTDSFQQIGPLVRWVEDLDLLLPIIAGPDGIDPAIAPVEWRDPKAVDVDSLRVSFHTDNGIRTPTVETAETIQGAAEALAREGVAVEEARPDHLDELFEIGLALYFADGGAAVRRLLESYGTEESSLDFNTPALPAEALDAVLDRWWRLRSRLLSFFDAWDAILCPVCAIPAAPHGSLVAMEEFGTFSYTMLYNVTGWPGAVVRAGTSPEGLPIGVQIVTAPWREDVALALAARLESVLGGFEPPEI